MWIWTCILRNAPRSVYFALKLFSAVDFGKLTSYFILPFRIINGYILGVKPLISGNQIIKNNITLQWRHNEHDGPSNHWRLGGLLNVQTQIKENIKAPRHWSLCREFIEFPPQKASNAENVWKRHYEWK